MKWKKKQERAQSPKSTCIIRVLTEEQSPLPYTEGMIISNVKRVPVGRKLTSMEVFDIVFCTPFATARRFLPGWWWRSPEGSGSGREPAAARGVEHSEGVALYILMPIPSSCCSISVKRKGIQWWVN